MNSSLLIHNLESRREILNKERFYSQFQPLADLGYVERSSIRETMTPDKREAVIRAFRNDYTRAGISITRVNFERPDAYREYASMLNVAEERLLHTLVSLDGAFSFFSVPTNLQSLFYRIACFRFRLYGLSFEDDFLFALNQLKTLLGKSDLSHLQLLNMAGNLEMMIEAYLDYCKDHVTHKIAFVKIYGLDPGDEVSKLITSNANDFVARLYQLFLWKNEFYNGRIDGDLGTMSKQSLDDLISIVNKRTNRSLTLDNFTGGDGELPYELWNIGDLMRLYRSRDSLPARTASKEVYPEPEMPDGFPLEDMILELENIIVEDTGKNRQSYFGNPGKFDAVEVGALEHKLFRAINRHKNIQRRKKVLKRFIRASGIFKNTLRKLIQRLRNALTLFLHGFRYLAGERTVVTNEENNILVTQFDRDFDAILYVPGDAEQKTLRHHRDKVAYFSYSLQQSLSFTGKVIKIAWAVSGPLGWYKLARIAADLLEN